MRERPPGPILTKLGIAFLAAAIGCQGGKGGSTAVPASQTSSQAQAPDPAAATLGRLQKVEAFMMGQPYVVDRRLSVIRTLGRGLKEEVVRGPYPANPPVTMERRTLQFDGLRLEGFMKDDTFIVCVADYTQPGWTVGPSLGVGADAALVAPVLGSSGETEGDALVYRPVANGGVMFHTRGGRVTRIEINYGCD